MRREVQEAISVLQALHKRAQAGGRKGIAMQIKIWIRANKDGDNDKITLRTDHKAESYDTPLIWRYSQKLIAAIERGANGEMVEVENKGEG